MSCHKSITSVAEGFEFCQIKWFIKQLFFLQSDLNCIQGHALLAALGDIFYKVFLPLWNMSRSTSIGTFQPVHLV